MRKPPKNNTPLNIHKIKDIIFISARLFKANTLSHDPNIGAISGICAALRKLGFKENLTITHHGLEQKHLGKNNKFIQSCILKRTLSFRRNGAMNVLHFHQRLELGIKTRVYSRKNL